jgi:heme A synthase
MLSIHSHTRYLVLLVGVVASLYAIFGLISRRPADRVGLTLLRVFAGVLDLQILLGIITLMTRAFLPALIGHIVMMIAAAAVAHLGAVRLKKMPEAERGPGLLLASVLIPLGLIVGGILAIHRALL